LSSNGVQLESFNVEGEWELKVLHIIISDLIFDVELVLMDLDARFFIRQTPFLKDKISCYCVKGHMKGQEEDITGAEEDFVWGVRGFPMV